MYSLKDLEKKFSEIDSKRDYYMGAYLSEAQSRSRDTIISKGPLYNSRPYESERAGFKRGKRLKKIPASIKNTHVYHLDECARILFVEIYGQSENIINKEFYRYSDECVERTYFISTGKLRNVSVSLLEGDTVVRDLNWGDYGCSDSSYIYDGYLLDKVIVQQKEHLASCFNNFETRFEYGDEGLLRIINVFSNGYEEKRFP